MKLCWLLVVLTIAFAAGALAHPHGAAACSSADNDHCYAETELDTSNQGAHAVLHPTCYFSVSHASVESLTNELWIGKYNSGGIYGGDVWAETGMLYGAYGSSSSGYSTFPTLFTASYNAYAATPRTTSG